MAEKRKAPSTTTGNVKAPPAKVNTKKSPPTKGSAAPSETTSSHEINLATFSVRLQALYANWRKNKDEFWGSADVLAVPTPPTQKFCQLKSYALNVWLLGFEFPEMIMIFGKENIHILCSPKKASVLEHVKKSAEKAVGVDVVIHMKVKSESGGTQMDTMIRSIRSQSKTDALVVGCIAKEEPEGKLWKLWAEKLKDSGLSRCDITNGLTDLFAVKDDNEIMFIKKASCLTASAMEKFVVPKIEKVMDNEMKITHASLMEQTEKALENPLKNIGVRFNAENIDICYPPKFQSGGKFDLKPHVESNTDNLCYDSSGVIICAVGSRYNTYCSNVVRTYLIDSNAEQSKFYDVLLKAQEAAISAMKPGAKISAVYEAAVAIVKSEAPELVPNLTKSAGAGIGLELKEAGLTINAKNDKVLKAGMAFNVQLGFDKLHAETKNPKTKNYALFLADTVIVTDSGPKVATSISRKSAKDIAYSFAEEEEEEVEEKKKPIVKPEPDVRDSSLYKAKATLRSDHGELSKEELRKQHQAELARQKNEELARRLAGGESNGVGRPVTRTASEIVAYKNVNDVPQSRELMIKVDQRNEAVLLPIYGNMVPFHVSCVKAVSNQFDTISIMFNVPGIPCSSIDANCVGDIYVKQLTFRSKGQKHISEIVQQIKTLRRNVMARESEKAERASLVTQKKLVLNAPGSRFNQIKLLDLWIRPALGGRGRKLTGTLEAHFNGFRFLTSRKDEMVEFMFENIKHAFFQPAEKEQITLIHFHLHNHIMVGNKKTKDVQFYVEVMETVQQLRGTGKRSRYDPDEVEEEEMERAMKQKTFDNFNFFVTKINDLWASSQWRRLGLEFDQPLRELGFHGVPYKSSVFLVPTSTCLVEFIETPFVVVTLSEIEIVNLERVGLAQRNFDLAIVFKDVKKDVMRIDSIPSSSLDGIKEWLDTTDIKYYESRLNLNWKPILKTISEDPEQFIQDGGWEFLNLEGTDSDESDNDSEEGDKGYEPSDLEVDSMSEDDESESASLVESEDDEDQEQDEDQDQGEDWEELERKAKEEDREMGNESDSEDERRRRKMKASGKSKAAPSVAPAKKPKFR